MSQSCYEVRDQVDWVRRPRGEQTLSLGPPRERVRTFASIGCRYPHARSRRQSSLQSSRRSPNRRRRRARRRACRPAQSRLGVAPRRRRARAGARGTRVRGARRRGRVAPSARLGAPRPQADRQSGGAGLATRAELRRRVRPHLAARRRDRRRGRDRRPQRRPRRGGFDLWRLLAGVRRAPGEGTVGRAGLMSAVAGAPPITPGMGGTPPAEKQGMSTKRKIGLSVFGVWFGGIVLFVVLFGVTAHNGPDLASS